jgi:hypothetical protein
VTTRARGARLRLIRLIGLAVAVAAITAAAILTFIRSGSTPATDRGAAKLADPAAVTAYLGAAAPAVATVTSYDYRHLNDALTAGLALTTGNFRTAYRAGFAALRATAVADHTVQSFEQIAIGVGDVSHRGAQAHVLVFGTERRTGTSGSSAQDITLRATLVHRGDTYLVSDLTENENAGLPPGSEGLRAAAEAGRSEVVAVNSYRRAHFDADLATALAGAGGTLRDQLRAGAPATKAALTKGGFDLSGAVSAVAVVTVAPNEVVLMMAATGIKIASDGTRSGLNAVRFEVTVDRTQGTWLTTQLMPVRGS